MSKKNQRNKIAKATMAASLIATAGFVVEAQAADVQFTDIAGSSHTEAIKNLADQGFISGFGDNTYRPNAQLTRGQAAKILANILGLDTSNIKDPGFKDIKKDHQYYKYIAALKAEKVIDGFEDGTYRPNAKMTRGQMAKILAQGFKLEQDPTVKMPFTDVATSSYKGYIGALYKYGITIGKPNGTFGVTDRLSRAQMATFVVRANNTSTATEDFELSLLHTNDMHARADKMPKLATAVKEIRKEKPDALLIDAGDVFSGTLYFNTFEGQAELKLMNYIGYDVMTLGNHEFDLGSSPAGHKALADFIKAAKFSLVSSNVNVAADVNLKGLFSDVISSKPKDGRIYNGMIKEVNGEKVGFFGLTTAETKDISSPGSVAFEDYIKEAEKAVKAFEGMGVNKIVAVTHIGYDDNINVDNDLLLAKHVDGIDVIVGGHSHTTLDTPDVITADAKGEKKDPTVIVQTGEYVNNLGTLDVTFDNKGVVKSSAGALIKIGDQTEDAGAAAILKPYADQLTEVSNKEIGVILKEALVNPRDDGDTTKPSVRKDDTILANLITDGMLTKAKEVAKKIDANKEVVLAFQNGGGIRAAIDAGPVTVGEVMTVLPFGNTLALMDATGAELKAAFEVSVKSFPVENGGFLHVAGGVVKFDPSKPAGERVVSVSYEKDGKLIALEDNKTYTVATNAFTAKGGDGFTMFEKAYQEGRVTDLGLSDWENFRDHLINNKNVPTTVEDRVQAVEGGDPGTVTTATIADVRKAGTSKPAQTKGIVTGILNNTIQIEDATGAIALYGLKGDVAVGDEITVSGDTTEYRGLFQIQNAKLVERKENVKVVTPTKLNGKDIAEANESKFAVVEKVKIVSGGGQNFNATTADGGAFIVRDEKGVLNLEVGATYDSVAGIVQQFGDDYQIIPRSAEDVVKDATVVRTVKANPGAGLLAAGSTVTLSTATEGATIYYTTDGSTPTMASTKYTAPIKINAATTVKVLAVKDGFKPSEVATFDYKTYDPAKGLQIHDIQGDGHASPMDGSKVDAVQGVVTSSYELNGGFYFHMQTQDAVADNNPNTSQGIIVYAGSKDPALKAGTLVAVTGTVSEFAIDGNSSKATTDLTVTQINARDDRGGVITVVKDNVALPAPIKLTAANLTQTVIDNDSFTKFDPQEDGIDFWESLEGMRVETADVKAVAPQQYGEVFAVLDTAQTTTKNGGVLLTATQTNPTMIPFRLYNNPASRTLAEGFAVATGDKFEGPIVGVVNYGYSNYKVIVDYEDMKNAFVKGGTVADTTAITQAAGKLTVASYNLENFSANTAETSDEKAANIAKAIVTGMKNPDIIGVTEVQDGNGSTDSGDATAAASYDRLIAAIKAAGGPTYKYVNIDPENNKDGGAPGANIRVGFLYNADRVSLPTGIAAGTANTAVGYENNQLTANPGRIDPANAAFGSSRKPLTAQFTFNGEQVIVIANHWNSKSGDLPLWGKTQPVTLSSETQRVQIAKVVANFIKDVKTKNPAANVVAVGDFNDFQWTPALKELEAAGMHNMINDVPAAERYTYTYQGNSQVLDHILVSDNLKAKTIVDILNVNSDFTEMHGRASDHDPVLVQIDFNK